MFNEASARNLRPFQPGQSGNPGGRGKRILPRIDEILKANNLEPITELLKLLPNLKDREQAQIWLEILPYIHAKQKPMEEHEVDELEKMTTAELVLLVKEKLPEIA